MSKKVWVGLLVILIIPGFLFSGCCPKKKVPTEPVVTAPAELAPAAPAPAAGLAAEDLEAAAARRAMEEFVSEDIHFDFDKSFIRADAQPILEKKADWLRKNPDANITIEGHCDERGTNEYNLALGDRRAESAKAFLMNLGISGSRMTTVSYGEERPVDTASNEDAWAKNRRAHFVPKN